MSGSGSASFGGLFGQNSSDTLCENIRFTAQLSSPNPTVISQLIVGDIMDIQQTSQHGLSLTVAVFNGQVAGGIASPQIQRIRECIDLGTQYIAEVIQINGGQVMVKVYAV
ncbi:hypothetical protein OSB94_01845 [Proteus vulgaris]|uniref:hypothetical protein n=1 Tax=Proteus vulgaris TaxID=585 RepID=UPI00287558BD|nr:hypothetical protein [Proteus vulgaris]MDS0786829.1 hypothetical protein [Proteus vulgaris]